MKYLVSIAAVLSVLNFSFAQSVSTRAVEERTELLRQLMVDPDEKKLHTLLSGDLSYGHSSGRVEDRAALIRSLTSGESDFTSIELKEQTVQVTGDVALVRHHLIGSTKDKGKEPGSVKIGVLLVWTKLNGEWVLLARQAFKL